MEFLLKILFLFGVFARPCGADECRSRVPRRVSSTVRSIPLLLPRPVAQPATPPVSAEPLASCQNTPREMVLPIDFNVRDNYVQHSLMHIDPRHTGTVPHNRAHGAAAQNRSPLIKWAAKQENVRPLEMCFFLTPAFIKLYRLRVNRDLGGNSLPCGVCNIEQPKRWAKTHTSRHEINCSFPLGIGRVPVCKRCGSCFRVYEDRKHNEV